MKRFVVALAILPALAHAEPRKKLYVRAGIAYVHPFSTSGELELADVDGPASLAVSNGPVPGSGASVESTTIPALIVGYVLPVMDGKLAIETIIGPPLDVKFDATGSLANMSLAPSALGIPTGVPALGPQLGEAKGVPPVLTLVYSLGSSERVRPYVGAGVSVLFAYNAHTTNSMLTSSDMSISPAPGLVLQSGLEATIYKRIYARLDVKFIALMYARAEVHHVQMQAPDIPLFGTVEVGTAKIGTWVNPLIVQAGIGTDFW